MHDCKTARSTVVVGGGGGGGRQVGKAHSAGQKGGVPLANEGVSYALALCTFNLPPL